jgi:uncharacterized delta-60 repeat protein
MSHPDRGPRRLKENLSMRPFLARTRRPAALSSARHGTFRPRLEAMEDRCLLNAGGLDLTFGNGAGYVTTSLSGNSDYGYYPLVQPDGKIIAAGVANAPSGSATAQAALVRYNADGSLDTTFGTGGEALGPPTMPFDYWDMAALYPTTGTANDGKIVLSSVSDAFSVARYNANGTLDTTFGTNGIATANFGVPLGANTTGTSWVVIQPDGKIDEVGIINLQTLELARFNPDGSLDPTFGQGGMVTTPLLSGESNTSAGMIGEQTLLLQPNGGLIVSTAATGGGMNGHWLLIGYNADGSINTSFGTGGFVRPQPVNAQQGDSSWGFESAALYPAAGTGNDGKIVMAGWGATPGGVSELLVRRYNPNGMLDSTFGNGGIAAVANLNNPTRVVCVAIQPDGKILVSGQGNMVRLNTDGSLDSSFGTGGIASVPRTDWGAALQPNGAVVTAGQFWTGSKYDISVSRFLGQAASPYFIITGPSAPAAGAANTYTISVYNPDGSADTGYSGTVHITSSDAHAVLPANFTITGGTGTFSAILKTLGFQSLTATDTATPGITGGDANIAVNVAGATHFSISVPATVTHGVDFTLTVTALDAYGNVVTGYNDTVHFSSTVAGDILPADYTFQAADAGVRTFTNKTKLKKRGYDNLTVTDTLNGALTTTITIYVN